MTTTPDRRQRLMLPASRSSTVAIMLTAALAACGSGSAHPTSAAKTATSSSVPASDDGARPSSGCATTAPARPDANASHTLRVGAVDRTYLIATPPRTTPAPLIILLHGLGSNAADIDRVSDFPERARAGGVIVVTPNAVGSPAIWSVGGQGPDAAFLDALITEVEAHHCVDTSRVGIVGFSVGAVFAGVYGCTHQDRIAAIVTVEVDAPGPCTRPMPILAFHGTADPIVPYAPPRGSTALGGGTGTEANLATWAKISHCATTPVERDIGDRAVRLEWPHCSNGSDVVLYKIVGGGHAWPGTDDATARHASTEPVNATDEAVTFVARHALAS
jgi:polyhydroxybutyrate depolymerase